MRGGTACGEYHRTMMILSVEPWWCARTTKCASPVTHNTRSVSRAPATRQAPRARTPQQDRRRTTSRNRASRFSPTRRTCRVGSHNRTNTRARAHARTHAHAHVQSTQPITCRCCSSSPRVKLRGVAKPPVANATIACQSCVARRTVTAASATLTLSRGSPLARAARTSGGTGRPQ